VESLYVATLPVLVAVGLHPIVRLSLSRRLHLACGSGCSSRRTIHLYESTWIGTSSLHWNLVAQREIIRPVTPRELGKDGGIDVRVSNDGRSDGAPHVVGAEQERLDGALGKTMKEGEEEESDGDPVQSYPQVDGL